MCQTLLVWILILGLIQGHDHIFVDNSDTVADADVHVGIDVNVCVNANVSHIIINVEINCVSGTMQVEEQSRGTIGVSELSPGDIIRGIMGLDQTPSWCKVEFINPTPNSDNVTTFDGFTENHMVVENGTVRPYGKRGKVSKSQVYILATECDAAINLEGQAFTPISTTFCPHELGWSEYLLLMAAIRRVTQLTGYFWYSIANFHNNETAKVPYWKDMLHDMCIELLRCTHEGQCQEFENIIEEFVHAHINKPYMEIVEHVFPNIGGDVEKSEAGTVSEVVRTRGRSHVLCSLTSAMLYSIALTLMSSFIGFVCGLLVHKNAKKNQTIIKKEKKQKKTKKPKKEERKTKRRKNKK